jgi:type IV secretory pathway VirB3-like protein
MIKHKVHRSLTRIPLLGGVEPKLFRVMVLLSLSVFFLFGISIVTLIILIPLLLFGYPALKNLTKKDVLYMDNFTRKNFELKGFYHARANLKPLNKKSKKSIPSNL